MIIYEKLYENIKWLYKSIKLYDKWKKYRSMIWEKMFCDLCAMLIESVKYLYEALKSDYKLRSEIMISYEQKVKKNLICFSNFSRYTNSDLIDHLIISFENIRINLINMNEWKLFIVYKKPSSTFDKKRTHDHRISNLSLYKSFDICESSFKYYIHCESYINKQLCEQI